MAQMFENLVLSKRPQMPVERTLLSNGILLAGLESRRKGGSWVDTPEQAQSDADTLRDGVADRIRMANALALDDLHGLLA